MSDPPLIIARRKSIQKIFLSLSTCHLLSDYGAQRLSCGRSQYVEVLEYFFIKLGLTHPQSGILSLTSAVRCSLYVHFNFPLHDSIFSYYLHLKIQVALGFKICPKKYAVLPYLESASACKNQFVPNMANKLGQTWSFYFLVNLF